MFLFVLAYQNHIFMFRSAEAPTLEHKNDMIQDKGSGVEEFCSLFSGEKIGILFVEK